MNSPEFTKLAKVLDIVRRRYPKMTVGTLCTFIEIARTQSDLVDKELKMKDVSSNLGISYQTLIRQTDLLSNGVAGKDGLNLIEKGAKYDNKSTKQIGLNENGVRLIKEMFEILSADYPLYQGPEPQSS